MGGPRTSEPGGPRGPGWPAWRVQGGGPRRPRTSGPRASGPRGPMVTSLTSPITKTIFF